MADPEVPTTPITSNMADLESSDAPSLATAQQTSKATENQQQSESEDAAEVEHEICFLPNPYRFPRETHITPQPNPSLTPIKSLELRILSSHWGPDWSTSLHHTRKYWPFTLPSEGQLSKSLIRCLAVASANYPTVYEFKIEMYKLHGEKFGSGKKAYRELTPRDVKEIMEAGLGEEWVEIARKALLEEVGSNA